MSVVVKNKLRLISDHDYMDGDNCASLRLQGGMHISRNVVVDSGLFVCKTGGSYMLDVSSTNSDSDTTGTTGLTVRPNYLALRASPSTTLSVDETGIACDGLVRYRVVVCRECVIAPHNASPIMLLDLDNTDPSATMSGWGSQYIGTVIRCKNIGTTDIVIGTVSPVTLSTGESVTLICVCVSGIDVVWHNI